MNDPVNPLNSDRFVKENLNVDSEFEYQSLKANIESQLGKATLDEINTIRGKWHRREIDDREAVEQIIELLQVFTQNRLKLERKYHEVEGKK